VVAHTNKRLCFGPPNTLERPAMTVLATLHLAGQPLRVGEIATRMPVVGPHVTRHVDGLEKRGLIRRVTDALAEWSEHDRRELSRLLTRLADDLSGHLSALGDEGRGDHAP
jgi:Mn-dependent DtxR family transcriptional regulator